MIMEGEKSQDMPSTILQTPRRVNDVSLILRRLKSVSEMVK